VSRTTSSGMAPSDAHGTALATSARRNMPSISIDVMGEEVGRERAATRDACAVGSVSLLHGPR
jgi:hypothetical protein